MQQAERRPPGRRVRVRPSKDGAYRRVEAIRRAGGEMSDPRAVVECRVPAAELRPTDLINTSPGGDDDWQEVLGVYPSPAQLSGAPDEVRALVKSLSGRYVVVQLTDIAPVDANVYFAGGTALAASTDDTDDVAVTDLVSTEDGVRTYLYTKYELVTIRGG